MRTAAARVSLGVLVLATAPLCLPASSQQFGQWWWEASLEAGGRSFDNSVDGTGVNEFEQTDLTLSLGVNGYIIHPAVARFHLGYDLLLSEVEGGRALDTDRSGFQANLGVFPNGSYSLDLSFQRQLFDYVGIARDEPLTLLGVPDRTTSWSGRLRARRGPLKGLLLGFEQSAFEFLDEREGDEEQEHQFVDWSSAGRKLNHHVRLEHRTRDFGRVELRFEDLIFNWDEHGDLGERWRWDLSAIGMERSIRFQEQPESMIDIYRLNNQLVRTSPRGDALTLAYNGGFSSGAGAPRTESHTLGARYQWRRFRDWQVTAFGDVSQQRSGGADLRAPQVGAALAWRRRLGGVDLGVNGSGSYRRIDREDGGDDSALAISLLVNLGMGDERKLRTELEASVAHNELRPSGEVIREVPDLGVRLAGLGTQNRYRGRLTLRRRMGRVAAHAYSDWTRRESSESFLSEDFEAEMLVHSLQVSGGRLNVTANVGENTVDTTSGSEQLVRFEALSASYRPWTFLSIQASWRTDQRRFDLGPDIDGERYEAGAEFQLGALALRAHAYETEERFAGGMVRTNRGLRWAVSRKFAGLLPIVSAPGR